MNVSKVKTFLLGAAIAIILALFVGYGINTFFPQPKRDDYCDEIKPQVFETQEGCENNGGKWTEYEEKPMPIRENEYICTKGLESGEDEFNFNCRTSSDYESQTGYCDSSYGCRKDFEDANEKYNKIVFIISGIVGLICIILSVALKLETVSAGIMGGGILTIIYGTIRYWGGLQDFLRLGILGLVLGVLIWLGYKKFMK